MTTADHGAPFAPKGEAASHTALTPGPLPYDVRGMLAQCESFLDGLRRERDRTRFERRWNDIQDDAATLAHYARAALSAPPPPEPVVRWCLKDPKGKLHLDAWETEESAMDSWAGSFISDESEYEIVRVEIREAPL